jgi:aarF domain-containing kinase
LLNRDYTEIGQDFINLDFIPEGTDTRPIVPALTKVFDAALAGGGAKSINFQDLAADLAEITFDYVGHVLPVDIVQCLLSPMLIVSLYTVSVLH